MPQIHIQTLRRAVLDSRFPNDVERRVKESLRIFLVDPSLFDKPGLQGPAKRAELVLKLGYWLALGQLTEKEFRIWVDCVPPEDNAEWDVELIHAATGSLSRNILKMGPLNADPESCLVQEPT